MDSRLSSSGASATSSSNSSCFTLPDSDAIDLALVAQLLDERLAFMMAASDWMCVVGCLLRSIAAASAV
jgi:hypothetical protein